MTELNSINILKEEYLGRLKYKNIDQVQKDISDQIRGTEKICLFGFEVEPVVTLGRRACQTQEILNKDDIEVYVTDRGGFATLHSPGQLVIFPILDLFQWKIGVREFVELINQVTQELLLSLGIDAQYSTERPGLYTTKGKIAFTGIKIDRGVVRHGIALNVNNNLDLFSNIRSCGIADQKHDRISHYFNDDNIDLKGLFETWKSIFSIKLRMLRPHLEVDFSRERV